MGAAGSRTVSPVGAALSENKPLVVDVSNNMDALNKIVHEFGANNTESILVEIAKYNKQNPNNQIVVNQTIIDFIKKFNDNLVGDKLQYSTLPRDQVIGNLDEFKSSQNLYNAIKTYVSRDISIAKDKLLNDPVINNNTDIKQSVDTLFTKFTDIKARDTFFQYKYSQLYVFLIAYVEHVYKLMDKFVTDVTNINMAAETHRRAVYSKLLSELVSTLTNEQLVNNDAALTSIDNFNVFLKDLQTKVEAKQKQQAAALVQSQTATLEGVLQFLINSGNVETATLNNLAAQAQTQANMQATKAQVPVGQPQPLMQQQPSTPSITNPFQNGGFIRDGSTFPQAFFELK